MNPDLRGGPRTRKLATVRRQEIVDAAIQIIGEKGYPGLTIHGVAARCGFTSSGVMHHFATKDDILLEVLREAERRDEDALKNLRETAFSVLHGGIATRAVVLISMHAIVERNVGQPEILKLFTVLRAEAINADHPAHSYFQSRLRAVLVIFSDLLRPISPAPLSMARQLMALMRGLEAQWIAEGQAFDLLGEWDRAAERLLPADPG